MAQLWGWLISLPSRKSNRSLTEKVWAKKSAFRYTWNRGQTSDLIAKPEKDSAIKYKVVIKRDGIVYDGVSLAEANGVFQIFMSESKQSDDLVTLFQDSEIVRQWYCHFEAY